MSEDNISNFHCPICKKQCKSNLGVNIHLGKAHPEHRREQISSHYLSKGVTSSSSIENVESSNPDEVHILDSNEDTNNKSASQIENESSEYKMKVWEEKL